MTLIRFTVADARGTSSFVGPCHVIKMLVAACARNPATVEELLGYTERFDADFARGVLNGLAVFDEHNLRGHATMIEHALAAHCSADWPPFRVLNEVTHRASTQPAQAGLIVFNLTAKRIIQVQNSYAEIQRRDRGRRREGGRPTRSLYHYELPQTWSLVP
jgi:hypothetical protein